MSRTLSHGDALKRAGLPTLETLTRRILRAWDSATASDIESGARWYEEAGDIARSLAGYDNGNRRAVTVDQAARIIAALSPRTSWSRNVAGAFALVKDGPDAARSLGCIGANIHRAMDVLINDAALGGPKTRAFAANIAGDREAVTVDVWAARAAGIDETLLSRVGVYDAIAHAYRLAARRVGVDPATMQATTWIVARNGRAS